jgi:hypothetical protein
MRLVLTKFRTKQNNDLFASIMCGLLFMSEEKVNLEEISRKVDELLSVLNVIAGDLAELSKSLKAVARPAAAPVAPVAPAKPVKGKKLDIAGVKQAFSPDLSGMLFFEELQDLVIVKPRRFLGSDNFAKIASVVRELGGEYVSAGKNSHFEVPK